MKTLISLPNWIKTQTPLQTIFWSGLMAGILDAMAGVIVYYLYFHFNPFQVLESISSGIFGAKAINGSFIYVLIGLVLHFIIAFTAASILFLLFLKTDIYKFNPIILGLGYGLIIWLFMNLLVLPLSNYPKSPFDLGLASIGIAWHMILVGVPMTWIIWKYPRR